MDLARVFVDTARAIMVLVTEEFPERSNAHVLHILLSPMSCMTTQMG